MLTVILPFSFGPHFMDKINGREFGLQEKNHFNDKVLKISFEIMHLQ